MKSTKELPSRTSTDWIIGWKASNLIVDEEDGELCFSPCVHDGLISPFRRDALADCNLPHKAPALDHVCGFNAFHEQSDAVRYLRAAEANPGNLVVDNLVLLRVGLHGRVIEGTYFDGKTWGYKAERQRVADVLVPRRCRGDGCHEQASCLGVRPGAGFGPFGLEYLRPLCQRHAAGARVRLTPGEASRRFRVPVSWLLC